MDTVKRNRLVAELSAQPEPQIVPLERFFDGNDDVGSIGCNLLDHPGVAVFRDTFARIARRPDVEAVYAQIAELDPGEGCWPFTDTVLVVGTVSPDVLARELVELEPDEVGPAAAAEVHEAIARRHAGAPVLVAWWD